MAVGRGYLETLITELKDLGMQAVETYYTEHERGFTDWLLRLAARLDLGLTGGSDFHGGPKPDVQLGVGRGDLRVPAHLLKDLRKRLAGG